MLCIVSSLFYCISLQRTVLKIKHNNYGGYHLLTPSRLPHSFDFMIILQGTYYYYQFTHVKTWPQIINLNRADLSEEERVISISKIK